MNTFGKIALAALLTFSLPATSQAKKDVPEKGTVKVLVVGLHNNVKSNYYYKEQIAEQTGIQADSIDHRYNNIFSENIVHAGIGTHCSFIATKDDTSYENIISKIAVNGEGEECNSNLSALTPEELQAALDHADADYLLVLNQHYLKWQSQPMRTVYHMVSYTLYDKNKKALYSGNQHFASINLEKPEKVAQLSRKTTSKIASSVEKSLDL